MSFDPLTPCMECGKPLGIGQVARGCHQSPCYQALRDSVKAGKATWEQLIATGRCTAANDTCTNGRAKFKAEMEAKKQ